MEIPSSILDRLRSMVLRLCRDVIIFGAGAVTACALVGYLRRHEE